MLHFLTNDLMLYLAILISGLVSLLVARLVLIPRRQHKRAQKNAEEIMQRKAMKRVQELRIIENDRTDVWSTTRTRDTISRELTLDQRRSLENIGEKY